MKILKKEYKLCMSCMESHEVCTIEIEEKNIFKGKEINYTATYEYCDRADEYYATEQMLSSNDIAMKNAYRKQLGLLTSHQIVDIRYKYGISQSDLSNILGWGEKTITRYEGHQVQDVAYDTILRKIDVDPEWYLELLKASKDKLTESSYQKYYETALSLYEAKQNEYLRKVILTSYVKYEENEECTGSKALDLDKVIDIIRYFANSEKVKFLYKVKLMKLLWYTDALSFKKTGTSMTGLVYKALPMGAVPVGYEHIIDLNGINSEDVDFDEGTGRHFIGDQIFDYPTLSSEDKAIIEYVIDCFGSMNRRTIVDTMHKEKAYTETAPYDIIQYKYAKELSI